MVLAFISLTLVFKRCWIPFNVIICHQWQIHDSCPFSNWIALFFSFVEFWEFFKWSLDMTPVSHIWSAHILSQSMSCPFSLFIGSFKGQILLIQTKSGSFFPPLDCVFGVMSKSTLLGPRSWRFLSYVICLKIYIFTFNISIFHPLLYNKV